MSAWIEILLANICFYYELVALYMSAWIEIYLKIQSLKNVRVALYMSAWIEIVEIWYHSSVQSSSHST